MAYESDGARRAPASPSVAVPLGAAGIQGKITGVTRIGSKAGLVALAVVGAIILAIVYGISAGANHQAAPNPVAIEPQILPTNAPTFQNIPGADGAAQPTPAAHRITRRSTPAPVPRTQTAPVLPDPATQPALTRTNDVPDVRALPQIGASATMPQPQPQVASAADVAKALALEHERQEAQIADAARHAAILIAAAARTAPLTPTAAATSAPAGVAEAAPDPNADPAIASQRAKNDFIELQKSTAADDYALSERQAAISPYEVQAGSIIPGILVTGINSDLPGQMIGQVSRDVYDSKTGTYLLIPAGSKLVGRYDSQVTSGQSRVLVAWQRIIFPDSSFIDINGLTGSDTAGYSGFTGKVDDHSGKLFRNAILFSLIGAGASLLQPRTAIAALTPAAMVVAPSVGSQVAGQVGTQIANTAQQVTQKGLQQQPTIEVRPGYLFNIMVDRDLVLPGPYTK